MRYAPPSPLERTGDRMRKKRLTSTDLSWMIFDRMRDEVGGPRSVVVAVIPDEQLGWRAVLEGRGARRYLGPKAIKKFRSIETKLRSQYSLAPD